MLLYTWSLPWAIQESSISRFQLSTFRAVSAVLEEIHLDSWQSLVPRHGQVKLMAEHTKHTANLPLDKEKAPSLTLVAVSSVFSTGITLRQVNVVYISSGRISITMYIHTYVLWVMVVYTYIRTLGYGGIFCHQNFDSLQYGPST